MKTLLILGAGTGGTMVANKMVQNLDLQEWRIIIVDRDENHYYQPGLSVHPIRHLRSRRCGQAEAELPAASGGDDLFGYRS